MTLKYESEILFDLMKRDGDDTPSDVLPYESELKEKYLEQVEGAYPKLTDYRPEWLHYNLYSHLPADFPVEILSNVTNATVNNVVPYAYGSASLKGQTLVNLLDFSQWGNKEKITLIADGTGKRMDLGRNLPIKPNTKYLTIIPVYENTINQNFTIGGWGYFASQPAITSADGTGIIKIIKTTRNEYTDNLFYLELWKENTSGQIRIGKPMFIEYQEGMENWDIPYFEGMQSIQMPSLTTTGNNLIHVGRGFNNTMTFDGLTITRDAVNQTITLNGTATRDNTSQPLVNLFYREIKKDERYALSCYLVSGTADRVMFRVHDKKWSGSMSCELNKPSYKYFDNDIIFNDCSFRVDKGATFKNAVFKVMFERIPVNSNTTSYEPYQSNILTVNEEVELRGIGDVKDTLNLITGEVAEHIDEIVLNGSEDEKWVLVSEKGNLKTFRKSHSFKSDINDQEIPNIICDKLKLTTPLKAWAGYGIAPDSPIELSRGSKKNDGFDIIVDCSRATTINGVGSFKQWLSQNPLTIQHELETPLIKTVELTVTDQDGNVESIIRPLEGTMHVSTSSQTLSPLLDMSVPVEATTQNLMSFVNMKEEEK